MKTCKVHVAQNISTHILTFPLMFPSVSFCHRISPPPSTHTPHTHAHTSHLTSFSQGREEALCDYVFNETVLAYSHENTRHYAHTSNDYLNVWSMLWLSGLSQTSREVTLLNIDGIKRGGRVAAVADQPNQFFR